MLDRAAAVELLDAAAGAAAHFIRADLAVIVTDVLDPRSLPIWRASTLARFASAAARLARESCDPVDLSGDGWEAFAAPSWGDLDDT